MTIVDYSAVYFASVGDGTTPPQREGKFVVMANGDDRYIVFSPRGMCTYHANIVERFLSSQGVRGAYSGKRDVFYPQSQEWDILGGGHWQLDEEAGTLRLFGSSQAYGRVDLQGLAVEVSAADGFVSGHQIVIG